MCESHYKYITVEADDYESAKEKIEAEWFVGELLIDDNQNSRVKVETRVTDRSSPNNQFKTIIEY